MQEQLELVEVYLRERFGEREDNYTKRLHSRISESVKHFAERGISAPSEADFEALRAWVSMKDGKPKGKPISAKTVSDWVSETVNFYNWLIHRRQINMFEDEEREGLQNEPETPAVSENTSTGEEEDTAILEDEPVEQEHAPITGTDVQDEPDTHSLPVDAEPQAQAETPKPKNKGGRKVLDPNGEKRSEKVMLYLTPSLMDDLRDLANLYGKSIADYFISLAVRDAQAKQAKLALFRELRREE